MNKYNVIKMVNYTVFLVDGNAVVSTYAKKLLFHVLTMMLVAWSLILFATTCQFWCLNQILIVSVSTHKDMAEHWLSCLLNMIFIHRLNVVLVNRWFFKTDFHCIWSCYIFDCVCVVFGMLMHDPCLCGFVPSKYQPYICAICFFLSCTFFEIQ